MPWQSPVQWSPKRYQGGIDRGAVASRLSTGGLTEGWLHCSGGVARCGALHERPECIHLCVRSDRCGPCSVLTRSARNWFSVFLFLHKLSGACSQMPQLTSSLDSGYRLHVQCSLPVQEIQPSLTSGKLHGILCRAVQWSFAHPRRLRGRSNPASPC